MSNRCAAEILSHLAFELVVDLPGNQAGMMADAPRDFSHDAHAGGAHRRILIGDVLARAMNEQSAGFVDETAFGVAGGEPDRWRRGGGAEDGFDAGGIELVHHPDKKIQRHAAFVRLQRRPSELAHPNHVDPERLHLRDVVRDVALGPKLGIIRTAMVKSFRSWSCLSEGGSEEADCGYSQDRQDADGVHKRSRGRFCHGRKAF